MNLERKRVCVTGGNGFLGSHIVDTLYRHGCLDVVVPRHTVYDLRRHNDVQHMYQDLHPDVVIHCSRHVRRYSVMLSKPSTVPL